MPKRRPIGPPKWQKRKELKSKTKMFLGPMAAAKITTAVDTEKNVDFKIGLDGTAGLVAAATAELEAAKKDEMTDVMTTVGSTSVATVIAVIFFVAKIKLEVETAGRVAPLARLFRVLEGLVASTLLAFRSLTLQIQALI